MVRLVNPLCTNFTHKYRYKTKPFSFKTRNFICSKIRPIIEQSLLKLHSLDMQINIPGTYVKCEFSVLEQIMIK